MSVKVTDGSAVAVLEIKAERDVKGASDLSDSIYGGYTNGRGEITLFGKDLAYRVDLKKQTLQLRPRLKFWRAGSLRRNGCRGDLLLREQNFSSFE